MESTHSRARNACVGGLITQAAAFVGILVLAGVTQSASMSYTAWAILGGVPIWLAALLVIRQRELVVLEQQDLESLRREKRALGAEAMFESERGDMGFRVAEARLRWMQRWLVPAFSLATAAYLVFAGLWFLGAFHRRLPVGSFDWPDMRNAGLGMVISACVLFILFLYSRYASGLARLPEWSILRGCGAYMLGNALALLALIVCMGAYVSAGFRTWEHVLSYALPALLVLIGAEITLNFVLDVYRPRVPGVEPRAAFDSRLLGLLSEPGGLAHSIAEAINYQFGFQVSQTWFYQLLQRTFVPLCGVALLALWGLSTLVIVRPYEMAIVERLGRQTNAQAPLPPGLHFKLPWPIEVVEKLNTGQLHQIVIGAKNESADGDDNPHGSQDLVLWTDARHGGRDHFDFIFAPPRRTPTDDKSAEQAVPVHLLRMSVAIQYTIDPAALADFTRSMVNPHDFLRSIAWQELVRLNASSDVDSILGEKHDRASRLLAQRLSARVAEARLGIRIVYVGLQGIHPQQTVAQAFQRVLVARQQKVTAVREAQVTESGMLSAVAGSRAKAIALADAIDRRDAYETAVTRAEQALASADPARAAALATRLAADAGAGFHARVEAAWRVRQARTLADEVAFRLSIGLGGQPAELARATASLEQARADEQAAAAALETAVAALLPDSGLDPAAARAAVALVEARAGREFCNEQLADLFRGLEGSAAKILAEAQARRWQVENQAAAELARMENERYAYVAQPELYKQRRYLDVLSNGLARARKYFLGVEPGSRRVKLRIDAQESGAAFDAANLQPRMN